MTMHSFSILLLSSCLIISILSCKKVRSDSTSLHDDISTEESSKAKKKRATYPVREYTQKNDLGNFEVAVFAGGCFWCTEAAFERIEGIEDVISGYSGGQQAYPSYQEVGGGKTGHAEAIYIYYDREAVDFETLLDIFFLAAHDPTTLNRQGPDVGSEYRSAIYFKNIEQQSIIDKKIKELNTSKRLLGKIVTEVRPYQEFWVAEEYHQNYYELHPNHGYVMKISRPKVDKVLKTFPALIKQKYRL